MSDLSPDTPKGVLRRGWNSMVGDYAIAGGWALRGSILVVCDSIGGVFGFDGKSGKTRWSFPEAHESGLLALAIHPDGFRFATSGQDGCVRIWDASKGTIDRTIKLGDGWVDNLSWSTDGKWLAASFSRRVHVLDLEGEDVWQSEDHPSTISAIAWNGLNELATACYGRVSFFNGASGELTQKLEWKGSFVSLALSNDGNIVACGSQDKSVHFWRRDSGEDSEMCGYTGKPTALAFDEKDTLLATGGGEQITVWCFEGEGPEGTRPGILEVHVAAVTSLTFTRRGRRLASGARDGIVVVWDLLDDGTGAAVGAAVVDDVVSSLIWRPDGRALAALDASGKVTVWRVSV